MYLPPLRTYFAAGATFLIGFISCFCLLYYTNSANLSLDEFNLMTNDKLPPSIMSKRDFGQEPTTENDNGCSTSAKIQGSKKKKSKSTEFDILHELDVLSGGHGAENLECPSPLVPYQN
jgi:hypothetical protein